ASPSHDTVRAYIASQSNGSQIKYKDITQIDEDDIEEMDIKWNMALLSMRADRWNASTATKWAIFTTVGGSFPTAGVPTVSGSFCTVSAIFTTASVVTPYTRRTRGITIGGAQQMRSPIIGAKDKGKQKVVESESKLLSKKEQREFYMSVLRSHAGWKTRHLRGMTLEEIKEKFIPVWKQLEDFVPMSSKEEAERVKRKGLKLDQGGSKRIETSEDVSKEDLKGMMQLVPLEEVYVEDLQATKDKEKELWVELNRFFELDFEDQIWTLNQALMHDPLDWKLYDTCGVHHVSTKDQEIFMLVERDYPLRRGLATVMICNKLQVENYSQMDNDLILKIHNIANSPR
nr:hypothetical protein [Tanacetum cinerariifolium]